MAPNPNQPQGANILLEIDPRNALDTAMEAARIASPVISGPDGRTWAALPERIKLHDISDPNRLPSRVRQTVTVDDRASLLAGSLCADQPSSSSPAAIQKQAKMAAIPAMVAGQKPKTAPIKLNMT